MEMTLSPKVVTACPGRGRLLVAVIAATLASCTASLPPPAPLFAAAADTVAMPQQSAANEPVNVGSAKLVAVAYHDSGDYMRELARAAARANDWLRERASQVPRAALATGPCLLPQGPCGWHTWDLLGQDAAIEPTRQVFQTARSLGVTVFFISGRPESERAATERNLKAVGYAGYAQAYFTPTGAHFASLVDLRRQSAPELLRWGM
jgi:acid phosphatase